MTDYHDLNTPEKGVADWHLPLNENFRDLDRKIEIRDEAAARSDYPPKAGAKFLATDTGAQWIGDGDAWNRIASTGDSPELESVTHRDPAGGTIQRDCLLAGTADGPEVTIPAEDDYSFYYIRLPFAGGLLRMSFNKPVGDTLQRAELLSEDVTGGILEVHIAETNGPGVENQIVTFGQFEKGSPPGKLTLGQDEISSIHLDGVGGPVEAWGLKYE